MKFKKLLPIAAVASTAAVVAPLVTSCGIASINYSTGINKDGTLQKEYTHKVERHAPGSMTDDVAKKTYFDDVAKNPMILADDWVSTEYLALTYEQPELLQLVNDDPEITYSGSGSISISLSKYDANEHKISGKASIKYTLIGEGKIDGKTFKYCTQEDNWVKFNNVPIDFKYDADYYVWNCLPDTTKLPNDDTWNASYLMNTIELLGDVQHGYSTGGQVDKNSGIEALDEFLGMLTIYPFYLEKVERQENP